MKLLNAHHSKANHATKYCQVQLISKYHGARHLSQPLYSIESLITQFKIHSALSTHRLSQFSSTQFTICQDSSEWTCVAVSVHVNWGMGAFTPDLRRRRMRNCAVLFSVAFRPQTSLAHKRSKGNDVVRGNTWKRHINVGINKRGDWDGVVKVCTADYIDDEEDQQEHDLGKIKGITLKWKWFLFFVFFRDLTVGGCL